MEATPGNSIFDFETLFSEFQECLNGSGLSRVRLIRVRLVLVNLNPINDTYIVNRTLGRIVKSGLVKVTVPKTSRQLPEG